MHLPVFSPTKDEGGVEEIDASDASQTCCLPGQLGVRLATIGVQVTSRVPSGLSPCVMKQTKRTISYNIYCLCLLQLEKHFGSPRDIEWAVRNQTVYILQVGNLPDGVFGGIISQAERF